MAPGYGPADTSNNNENSNTMVSASSLPLSESSEIDEVDSEPSNSPTAQSLTKDKFELPPLLGLAHTLPVDSAKVVEILRHKQVELLQALLDAVDVKQFVTRRNETLPLYWDLSRAIGGVLSADLERRHWFAVAREAVATFKRNFLEVGPKRFGRQGTEEILFAVSTLGRSATLLTRLIHGTAEPLDVEE